VASKRGSSGEPRKEAKGRHAAHKRTFPLRFEAGEPTAGSNEQVSCAPAAWSWRRPWRLGLAPRQCPLTPEHIKQCTGACGHLMVSPARMSHESWPTEGPGCGRALAAHLSLRSEAPGWLRARGNAVQGPQRPSGIARQPVANRNCVPGGNRTERLGPCSTLLKLSGCLLVGGLAVWVPCVRHNGNKPMDGRHRCVTSSGPLTLGDSIATELQGIQLRQPPAQCSLHHHHSGPWPW